MNFHLPQTHTARAEAQTLLAMPYNILTPQSNDPICGPVQDALFGSYLMTRRGEYMQYVSLEKFCDLVMYIDGFELSSFGKRVMKHFDKETHPYFLRTEDGYKLNKNFMRRNMMPSYLVWSACFPDDFYFQNHELTIKNGILVEGTIAKRHIGPHGVLLDKIAKYTGVWDAADWMSNIENITNIWLASHGFSIGLDDFLTENDDEILKTLAETELKYEVIRDDETKRTADKEQSILVVLNSTISVGERLAKKGMNHGEDNALNICIRSKAKGTFMNITQIAAALGQQNVSGGRIPKMLNGGTRSLPYFEEDDNSPAARGFVSSNLLDGLSLPEAQFHAFGGREGLIDTACKTKETGYFQRSLVKTNEDLVVSKNTMVMSYQKIVQFVYGGDNFDGTYLSKVKFPDGKIRLFFCDPSYLASKMCTLTKTEPELLNQEEIEKLLKIVQHPMMNKNVEFIEQMLYNVKTKFSVLLRAVKIPNKSFNLFYSTCEKMFNKAVINVGESVGIIAAGAIGEMSTQSTLNTFHSSGAEHKTVTQGVPRLKELKNSTAKPKSRSAKIYLKEHLFPFEQNEVKMEEVCNFFEEFNKEIKQIKFGALLKELIVEIFEDTTYPKSDPLGIFKIPEIEEEWWVEEYKENLDLNEDEIFTEQLHCGYRLRLNFDEQVVYDNCTNMFELCDILYKKLSTILNLIIIPSPTREHTIVMYFSIKREAHKITEMHGINKNNILNEENTVYLCLRDILIPIIKQTFLHKATGVNRFFTEVEDNENLPIHKKYFIGTEGGDFETILSLDCVDATTCTTDDFWQVYRSFDIEAAKRCLTLEFFKALTGDGAYIDKRLIELTVDNLCRRGTIDSMRRDSVPSDVTGPIQKMAFEKPIHYVIQSVINGCVDPCLSASGAITLGNNPQVGTEFVSLVDQMGELVCD